MSKTKNPTVRRNFTKVPNILFEDVRLRPCERLVVMYVLSFEHCYASLGHIGERLGYSRSTIQRAMARLQNMSVIDKVRGGGYTCYYVVRPVAQWLLVAPVSLTERRKPASS